MAGLTLKRKVGESVVIGENIRVTVVEMSGKSGELRLKIEAPRDVNIVREELRNPEVKAAMERRV